MIEEVNDGVSRTMILSTTSLSELRAGNPGEARSLIARGLGEARDLGAKPETIYLLEAAAELALDSGEPEMAARMIALAGAARRRLGLPMIRNQQQLMDALLARAGAGLSPQALALATSTGENETLESGALMALAWLVPAA